jgi:hypothetical protein
MEHQFWQQPCFFFQTITWIGFHYPGITKQSFEHVFTAPTTKTNNKDIKKRRLMLAQDRHRSFITQDRAQTAKAKAHFEIYHVSNQDQD